MANKCLVTRLKAAIQNDDLPLFDTVRLNAVTKTSTARTSNFRLGITIESDSEVTVRVDGDGYFANTFAELSDETKRMTSVKISSTTKNLYFKNGTYNVYLQEAHNLRSINIEGYSSSGDGSLFHLNLAELVNAPGLTMLRASQSTTYGSISYLPSTINDLMVNKSYGEITGDITAIANKCILSNRLWIEGTGISGSIEGLVAGQVSQGVEEYTSYKYDGGNLSSTLLAKTLTIGGISPVVNISYVSWSGNNRIICADNVELNSATTIYAKGATSSEISAWEAAGKTVVVIDDGE